MSTLGLRLGLEAVRHLTGTESVEWQFCYHARTCAADGIGLALEKSLFETALQVEQRGQHLLLCSIAGGRELSFSLSEEAMQLANQYRELAEEEKKAHLEMLRIVDAEKIIDDSRLSD